MTEITLISQRVQVFEDFLFKFHQTESKKIESNNLLLNEFGGNYVKSTIYNRLDSIMIDYLILEEYYIKKSVEKAIKRDSYNENEKTSSCVDEVFYVIKQSALRVISSYNTNATSIFIGTLEKLLEKDYCQFILKKINSYQNLDSNDSKVLFMVNIN